jgi:peptide/nickel transport system permease protein
MPLFLLKRLLTLIATLLAASVVVFWVLEILPGNAAQILMGPDASPEAVQALARQLGLDHPPLQRYGSWIAGMLTGNLGNSYVYSTPVLELVLERLTLTVPLAVMAMAMTTVLALAVGVYAASHHNRAGDVGLMAATQVGVAIPNFWFAILLILLFAVHLRWFAAGGFPGWEDEGVLGGVKALLLPAISLAVVQAAILARITRSAVLEVMREDYVRTARAKGLSRRATLWRHVLRNAPDSGGHRDGLAVRQPAGRHHRRGERLLPSGPGAADLPVDLEPGPDRRAQLRHAAGGDGGHREFRRRSAVRGDRPPREGQRHMSRESSF